jgi:dephospho-CoA kinase
MIIGISGRLNAGKDTLADILLDLKPEFFEKKAYAYKLKQIANLLTGISIEKFNDGEFKKQNMPEEWNWFDDPEDAMSVREFLQELGTEAIRDGLHENAWVIALMADYKADEENNLPNWIITDVRFHNEAEAIRKKGGMLIRLNRKGQSSSEHSSELHMNDWGDWDFVIDNDGSISDLTSHATKIIEEIEINLK